MRKNAGSLHSTVERRIGPLSGQSVHRADFAIPLPDKMVARFKGLFTTFHARDLKHTSQAKAFLFR